MNSFSNPKIIFILLFLASCFISNIEGQIKEEKYKNEEKRYTRKAVRENGKNVWYLLAKDEGHGFQKKVNKDYLINSTILFLEENLLK